MILRLIASQCGILRVGEGWWAYVSISRNSRRSTSSNGWSHATIHSAISSSNLFWSQGPYSSISKCSIIIKICTCRSILCLFLKRKTNVFRCGIKVLAINLCLYWIKDLFSGSDVNFFFCDRMIHWPLFQCGKKSIHDWCARLEVVDHR